MRRFDGTLIRDPARRRKAVEWCHEHGVNPNVVPPFAMVDILDDEHLELEIYQTTATGQFMWDETRQQPLMSWLHVKYNRPIPPDLLED